MDIIKQILNVSDIKLLDKVKAFIASCKNEEESALAKENCITVDLQREIDEASQEYLFSPYNSARQNHLRHLQRRGSSPHRKSRGTL